MQKKNPFETKPKQIFIDVKFHRASVSAKRCRNLLYTVENLLSCNFKLKAQIQSIRLFTHTVFGSGGPIKF